MPSLAELTDYYPQASTDLPVEPLYLPDVNTNDVSLSTGEDVPTRITVRPEPRPEPIPEHITRSAIDKLLGIGGERYQLWPEKILREGLSATGDVMKEGTLNPGLRREDYTDIPKPDMPTKDSTWLGKLLALAPVAAQPGDSLIEKAQAISALAGTGGLAGADATLGSAPFLRPALKYKDKLYKGKEGQQHMDVIPKELYPEFEQMAMSGEDISHYNFGFVNEKGHFLNREKALEHAINNGLIDPVAGQYGALTSTLMADSSKPGVAIEAMAKTASPFYSALEHNVGNISQNKMTGEQWLGTLSNKPGVKPEEMQWTGLQDFLQSKGKEPVTKEQIQEHLQNNKVELKEVRKGAPKEWENLNKAERTNIEKRYNERYGDDARYHPDLSVEDFYKNNFQAQEAAGATKYHSYQLPGGENYREMLLTLPKENKLAKLETEYKSILDEWKKNKNLTPEKQARWDTIEAEIGSARKRGEHTTDGEYKSSHWDEPNILAHVRMNDRSIDGKKSLHLEEIQSDWHQQGRDKGYKQDLNKNELAELDKLKEARNKKGGITGNDLNRYVELSDKLYQTGVPDAPFKKSWHELALKRMIREAAEKGYDRLSWTPGEAQAARYDLSKQIDRIEYNPKTKNLAAYDKNDNQVIDKRDVTHDNLAEYVGKEAAEKIKNTKPKGEYVTLENADLKIGGEGMKGFYDQIIPKALEKIGKEHGVKVKTYEQLGKLSNKMDKPPETVKIHYIDIPQSLRDAAMHKGFPLFSKGGHMLMPVDHEPDFGDK